MTLFDIKLIDGRYFKNVVVSGEYGAEDNIRTILDNYFYNDNGEREDLEMSLWDEGDDDCVNELTTFYSKDIEYVALAY